MRVFIWGAALFCLLVCTQGSYAKTRQMANLVDILDIEWGGYTSVGIDFGTLGTQYPSFLNWRAVLLMNHVFSLGFSGRNLLGQYTMPLQLGTENAFLKNSYLGFSTGIHFFPGWPFHLSTYFTFGSGRIGYTTVSGAESTENYFVIIPEVAIEIRLVEFLQFALEGRYPLYFRFNNLLGLNLDDMNGFYWGISVRFGAF